jgi:uncharacterized SAM-binding protein YcdF (DUF218 family)
MGMKKKTKFFLAASILILLLVLSFLFTDVYLVLLGPLETGAVIHDDYGDTILVLGGGLRKGRKIGYSTEERLVLAAELFRRKKRIIIISDGSLYRKSPAIKKITDFLVKNGVDKQYIRLEGKSQTTVDSFYYTREILEKLNAREIIVCTSPYHQRRARLILNRLKLTDFKIARMRRSEIHQAHSVGQRMRNLWLIVREYLAIVKFEVSGK